MFLYNISFLSQYSIKLRFYFVLTFLKICGVNLTLSHANLVTILNDNNTTSCSLIKMQSSL